MKAAHSVIIAVLFALTSLFGASVQPAHAEEELIVSAAASLTNAFEEIGKKFEAAHPGVKVVNNFAASGPLLQQIEKGAPVDVFASADQKTMNDAQTKKLIDVKTRKNFVRNSLVLIVPESSTPAVKELKDLSLQGVAKIALGNPESVPVGRYAKESLTKEGLWDALSSKFIMGESVRQVLDYVVRGEVEAGIVFQTDATVAKGKVKIVATLQNHEPILYPVAVVDASTKKKTAGEYIDFINGETGREILAKYGFLKP